MKAVGIPVLTDKVDIAHARLEFAGGAVANVTASRVSTERVRKMRFFQQHEYISLDYARRDALRVAVKKPGPQPEFAFEKLPALAIEPLQSELQTFIDAVRTRREPRTGGRAGRAALDLAAARHGKHPGTRRARPTASLRRRAENRRMIPRLLVPMGAKPPAVDAAIDAPAPHFARRSQTRAIDAADRLPRRQDALSRLRFRSNRSPRVSSSRAT